MSIRIIPKDFGVYLSLFFRITRRKEKDLSQMDPVILIHLGSDDKWR